jgi:hypothetical protein
MNVLVALFAPLALLVPGLGIPGPGNGADNLTVVEPAEQAGHENWSSNWIWIGAPFEDAVANQVRIEQRVIIRIAPRGPVQRESLFAEFPAPAAPARIVERKMGKCVPVGGIAGVQARSSDKLLLFMRDQRVVSAALEKACSARDFYSGFYIERSGDGMLCVNRDKLHARSGANCEIRSMRQLLALED